MFLKQSLGELKNLLIQQLNIELVLNVIQNIKNKLKDLSSKLMDDLNKNSIIVTYNKAKGVTK